MLPGILREVRRAFFRHFFLVSCSGQPYWVPVRKLRGPSLRVLQLQGGVGFAGAERVVQEAMDILPSDVRVALDLTRVYAIDDVARRVLLEVARRLTLTGHEVYLVDPESIMPDPDPGDGGRVTVVDNVDQAVIPARGSSAQEPAGYESANPLTRLR
ncbi:STAS domain-containing protein [Streptomyces sp. MCAF7]